MQVEKYSQLVTLRIDPFIQAELDGAEVAPGWLFGWIYKPTKGASALRKAPVGVCVEDAHRTRLFESRACEHSSPNVFLWVRSCVEPVHSLLTMSGERLWMEIQSPT